MKKLKLNIENLACVSLLLSVVLYSCKDTQSFENIRKLKTGQTLKQVENTIGNPIDYKRLNDSMESRRYVYDSPKSQIDQFIEITYKNEIVINIKNN